MGLERVAHDGARVAVHQVLERVGALVLADAVHDGVGGGQAPHLPRLVALAIEPWPARLVEADDGLRQDPGEQRTRGRLQASSERLELVPERLRRNEQTVAPQDALLAGERDVIEVLVDGDLDREVERVTATGHGSLGSGRGLDASTAFADVLLLLDLDHAVADLDDVDHSLVSNCPFIGASLAPHLGQVVSAASISKVCSTTVSDGCAVLPNAVRGLRAFGSVAGAGRVPCYGRHLVLHPTLGT